MDVTATRLVEASSPTHVAERIMAGAAPRRADDPPHGRVPAAPGGPPDGADAVPWLPRSTLKMGLSAADVDVKFEIGEGSRVTVTMLDRITGEVLRQIPPRELQDIIETLQGRGLIVDVTR